MAERLAGPTNLRARSFQSSDIDDRLSWMESEIGEGKRDPRIRKIAAEVLSARGGSGWEVAERDWHGELSALFNYVRENVRYTRDIADVELFQSPRRTLELKIGDCDDLSILLGSLCQSVGFPVMLRVVGLKGSSGFQHVYALAGVPPFNPEKWIALDASQPQKVGWELPAERVSQKRDYLITD